MIQAIQEYGEVDIFTANFRPLKATLSGLPDRVLMKLIVCANTNKVLGVHMCGEDSPEIIQVAFFPTLKPFHSVFFNIHHHYTTFTFIFRVLLLQLKPD